MVPCCAKITVLQRIDKLAIKKIFMLLFFKK
jgi:hypothetical protein